MGPILQKLERDLPYHPFLFQRPHLLLRQFNSKLWNFNVFYPSVSCENDFLSECKFAKMFFDRMQVGEYRGFLKRWYMMGVGQGEKDRRRQIHFQKISRGNHVEFPGCTPHFSVGEWWLHSEYPVIFKNQFFSRKCVAEANEWSWDRHAKSRQSRSHESRIWQAETVGRGAQTSIQDNWLEFEIVNFRCLQSEIIKFGWLQVYKYNS